MKSRYLIGAFMFTLFFSLAAQQKSDSPQAKVLEFHQLAKTAKDTEKENKPVFVLAFTHHYAGPGGYYASAGEVRKVAGMFHDLKIPGTLFFDGILVERLLKEEPAIFKDINEWNLSLGYHGEETHGPYPVPSDLAAEAYNLKAAQGYKGIWSLNTGKPWKEAVQQVIDRYSHSLPWKIDEKTRMLRSQGWRYP